MAGTQENLARGRRQVGVEAHARVNRIIPYSELKLIFPVSRTHLYRLESVGLFPGRLKIGSRKVGWWESEVLAALEALRKAGRWTPLPRRSSETPDE
jgi:predicted DNA-binding transcriptional regulator AlpA